MEVARLLVASMECERDRLRYLETERGDDAARCFAERTMACYRSAVVRRSAPAGEPAHRVRLIGAYSYLKHYLRARRRDAGAGQSTPASLSGGTMKRNATAVWQGGLKEGSGTVSTQSGTVAGAGYSFGTRFEQGEGTNPEELLAAAHAGCYSMALSMVLGQDGLTPERIDTTATVTIEPDDSGFTITTVHLDVRARIPGADRQRFSAAAEAAKAGCPVSKLFNAEITMDARLQE